MHDNTRDEPSVPARPDRQDTMPAPLPLAAIIRRIEETLEAETAALRSDPNFDLRASSARKSRHLYELTRTIRSVGEAAALAEHRESLLRLREKLTANEAVLRAHLGAVTEIAGLLRDAVQRAEADGTYSVGAFGQAG